MNLELPSSIQGTGGWSLIVVLLVIIIRVCYKVFKKDLDDVRESQQKDLILLQYKELADRYKKEAQENAHRADMFAEERNRAIEKLGEIRSEVERLKLMIERPKGE